LPLFLIPRGREVIPVRRFYQVWGALLCLLLAVSVCVPFTLAWQSVDQTARNDVRVEKGGTIPTPRPTPPPPVWTPTPTPDSEVVVTVRKIWEHGTNPEENRPASVVVYVYADGTLVHQQLVTAADGWKYTFRLPKYAAGKEITYTVGEQEVPGYEARVEGFDIVNTFIEKPQPSPTPTPTETPTPTPTPPPPTATPAPTPPPPSVAQTGDTEELTLWLAVTALGAVGLAVCLGLLYYSKHRYVGKRLMKK